MFDGLMFVPCCVWMSESAGGLDFRCKGDRRRRSSFRVSAVSSSSAGDRFPLDRRTFIGRTGALVAAVAVTPGLVAQTPGALETPGDLLPGPSDAPASLAGILEFHEITLGELSEGLPTAGGSRGNSSSGTSPPWRGSIEAVRTSTRSSS